MHCANPMCRAIADDLMKGTLTLIEFETPPEHRILYASGGFPVCSARTRYFGLCSVCSRLFTIRKWNASGLILERLPGDESAPPISEAERRPAPANPAAANQDTLYKTA